MTEISFEGKIIKLDEEGFLVDRYLWTETLAMNLAEKQNLKLTDEHWKLIHCAQNFYQDHEMIPPLRVFIKAVKNQHGQGLGNSLAIHKLFGESPLKLICKIAGLPKPRHCL